MPPPLRDRLQKPKPAAKFAGLFGEPAPAPKPDPPFCGRCRVNLLDRWHALTLGDDGRKVFICPSCNDQITAFLKGRPEALVPRLEPDRTPSHA